MPSDDRRPDPARAPDPNAILSNAARALGEVAALRRERDELRAQREATQWDLVEARADLQAAVERGRAHLDAAPHTSLRLDGWSAPTVVVPVHGALEEALRCVRSVLRCTTGDHHVLIVDDASPHPDVARALSELIAGHPHAHLHRHDVNLGYTVTIDEACRAVEGDVVLLNSDTEVAPGWLDGLREVAGSRRDVATVTPVSNAAGAFSVPEVNVDNGLPPEVDVAEMARLVRSVSAHRRPEVPTGNGFCLYVTRRALDAVGSFDVERFPRGYGEENDFCMRALHAGFVNLVDDATFVYHQRSASFGEQKRELVEASRAELAVLHPSYKRRVTTMLEEDPLAGLRARLRALLDEPAEGRAARPVVLVVLHNGGGGVPMTNADLMRAIAGDYRPMLLRCDIGHWELIDPADDSVVRTWRFEELWDATLPLGAERAAALEEACELAGPQIAHVRSLVAAAPDLVPRLKERGIAVVVSLHDFYTVCPTIQLLDEDAVYCAGRCTAGPGPCPTAQRWFQVPLPPLKHAYVHEWQRRMADALAAADRFVTTSESAVSVFVDHFPAVEDRLVVIPHGRDWDGAADVGAAPGDGVVRVVSFGQLGRSKGVGLIEELMRRNHDDGGPFEFHFLGPHHPSFDPGAYGGIDHGPYARGDLHRLLEPIRPSFAVIASVWPETYCHTLTEAWLGGLPVFASDIGALGERLREGGGGWLFPTGDVDAWYAGMRTAAADADAWWARRSEIGAQRLPTVDDMAGAYRALYRELLPAVV